MNALLTGRMWKRLAGCAVGLAFQTFTTDPAWGASSPGPAIGTRVNRTYDDGFVLVDASGNSADYTWHWSYENSSQVGGGVLRFHSVTYTGLVATVSTFVSTRLTKNDATEATRPISPPAARRCRSPAM